MSSQVCVDAGILIKVVVPEERSDLAVALWDHWAETLNCELWTADERLFNAVSSELAWVNWLGDFDPSG